MSDRRSLCGVDDATLRQSVRLRAFEHLFGVTHLERAMPGRSENAESWGQVIATGLVGAQQCCAPTVFWWRMVWDGRG